MSVWADVIVANPLNIVWIAVPLCTLTILIFSVACAIAHAMKWSFRDAARSAMIGASRHFEVATATAVILFGIGVALVTVVGVLSELSVMLMRVRLSLRTHHLFPKTAG